jgi:S-adenosylmethionine:tRNA ribosyltransferase-isomerase
MQKSDFYYELPPDLIAQAPLTQRPASRLLYLDGPSGDLQDYHFRDLIDLLQANDLLVLNDTKVIPARLWGHKTSGGRVEILVERILDSNMVLAHVRASKAPKSGTEVVLDNHYRCRVQGRENDLLILEFPKDQSIEEILERIGHIPLPPYITRPDRDEDRERYQTIFAKKPGAVAAPTAGLHFDADLLERLRTKGIDFGYITLHVGSGTFQPIRNESLDEHVMHSEYCELDADVIEKINKTRTRKGRIVAVGTTVVRTLETASRKGFPQPFKGDTQLFIRPGFPFHCVDAMITNFHLPESTLLTLVCAFAGHPEVMTAYRHAVEKRYRFFSYGDAMFVTRKPYS